MFFNNHVFAHLSSNGFAIQTSWYMGMHKPKPCSTLFFWLFLFILLLPDFVHVLTKHCAHCVFVQAQQQITHVHCTSLQNDCYICHFCNMSFRYINCKICTNSMQYWQENAHKNNSCYWYSVLINEHISPKEHETSFPLKNVVFER